MAKVKLSHTIDEELVAWLNTEIETKRFASISHGIEYALTVLKGMQSQPQIKSKKPPVSDILDPEIITESLLSLEAMRNKWYTDKKIGISIIKAGGIGIINLTNIIQKNPDLFETKEECRTWLHNKLKTEPPVIEEIETIKISNKSRKLPSPPSPNAEEPKFTPRRSTVKCPGCGEEQLELPGSPVRKCANCGFYFGQDGSTKPEPDQIAPAQDTPLPTPRGGSVSSKLGRRNKGNKGRVNMECLKIYNDDKNEQELIGQIKNLLNKRYDSGLLTRYEIRRVKGNSNFPRGRV